MPEQSMERLKVVEGRSSLSPMVQPTYPNIGPTTERAPHRIFRLPFTECHTEHLSYAPYHSTVPHRTPILHTLPLTEHRTLILNTAYHWQSTTQNTCPTRPTILTLPHRIPITHIPYQWLSTSQNTYHPPQLCIRHTSYEWLPNGMPIIQPTTLTVPHRTPFPRKPYH